MATYGIAMRATSGYVTDGANDTYSLGAAYPETRGGITFGWSANVTANSRNRSTTEAKIAGIVFVPSGGSSREFQIDLPSTGVWDIRLAAGDAISVQNISVDLVDGSTSFKTITGSTGNINSFFDANGTLCASGFWGSANTVLSHTFATTTFKVVLNVPASAASALAYVSVTGTADTTAPTLTSPTGTQTGSTTASGTVSTDEANGTLYYLASANATETAATVKAASSQAVSATGSQSVSFTGLTASTTYYAHYCHRDTAGNDSTVSNSASFTTAAGGSTYAPALFTMRSPSGVHFFGAHR